MTETKKIHFFSNLGHIFTKNDWPRTSFAKMLITLKWCNLEMFIFSSYKDMIFSYIFPLIRTFLLQYCTVGHPLKIWKKGIFEIDLFWFLNHPELFIFTFSGSWRITLIFSPISMVRSIKRTSLIGVLEYMIRNVINRFIYGFLLCINSW